MTGICPADSRLGFRPSMALRAMTAGRHILCVDPPVLFALVIIPATRLPASNTLPNRDWPRQPRLPLQSLDVATSVATKVDFLSLSALILARRHPRSLS